MPATDYEIRDDRFARLIHGNAGPDLLWSGGRWCEGPAYLAAGKYLVWSDIPNDRVMRWDECSGAVGVFEAACRNQNGHTVDREGRLIACEHRGRCVSRIEHDGTRTVLASHYDGKRFNSPNDVVVKSDGSIWFTDPSYGILYDYEGGRAESEIGNCNVYRVDPQSGQITIVADDFDKPNGLAFSPDEKFLYIADTGASHRDGGPKHIRKLAVKADGKSLGKSTVFAESTSGLFDGFRVDAAGRIWTSAFEGVHCYDPDGTLIGKILIPEIVSNVCFGSARLNRLFICGTTSLYSAFLAINGISPYRR